MDKCKFCFFKTKKSSIVAAGNNITYNVYHQHESNIMYIQKYCDTLPYNYYT